MRKILILFAHPRYEHSVVNRALVKVVRAIPSVTFHDLYEQYPDFNIDISHEKELLLNHDVLVWHHPFYWYSCPPLLKQWIDLVLEFNWAYGPKGDKLSGKFIFNAITSGGTREAYQTIGRNRFTVNQLLSPFEQTAYLCKMNYLPPFAVQGTHRISADELQKLAADYFALLTFLAESTNDLSVLKDYLLLNDFFTKTIENGR
jgi:glutathione-regulated potassium-efflux system ancillary protein KefG